MTNTFHSTLIGVIQSFFQNTFLLNLMSAGLNILIGAVGDLLLQKYSEFQKIT